MNGVKERNPLDHPIAPHEFETAICKFNEEEIKAGEENVLSLHYVIIDEAIHNSNEAIAKYLDGSVNSYEETALQILDSFTQDEDLAKQGNDNNDRKENDDDIIMTKSEEKVAGTKKKKTSEPTAESQTSSSFIEPYVMHFIFN